MYYMYFIDMLYRDGIIGKGSCQDGLGCAGRRAPLVLEAGLTELQERLVGTKDISVVILIL